MKNNNNNNNNKKTVEEQDSALDAQSNQILGCCKQQHTLRAVDALVDPHMVQFDGVDDAHKL